MNIMFELLAILYLTYFVLLACIDSSEKPIDSTDDRLQPIKCFVLASQTNRNVTIFSKLKKTGLVVNNKNMAFIILIFQYLNLKSDFKTVKSLNRKLISKSDIFCIEMY